MPGTNINLKDRLITAETLKYALENVTPVIPPGTYATPEEVEKAVEDCVKQDSTGEAWVRSIFTDADGEDY